MLEAASTVPGFAWPPISSPAAGLTLAMQHQLNGIPWLSSAP